MHLSPAAIESAIKLLDQPMSDLVRGDIGETGASDMVRPLCLQGGNGGGGGSRTRTTRFPNPVIARHFWS